MVHERKEVVEGATITHKGFFKADDVITHMDGYMKKKGYLRKEVRATEIVEEDHRNIEHIIEYHKKIKETITYLIWVEVYMNKVMEVKAKKDAQIHLMDHGEIKIVIRSYLMNEQTAYELRYYVHFIRSFINKFIWEIIDDVYDGALAGETADFEHEMAGFLHLYTYYIAAEEIHEPKAGGGHH